MLPIDRLIEHLQEEEIVEWFLTSSRLIKDKKEQERIILYFFKEIVNHDVPVSAARIAAVIYEHKEFKKTSMYKKYRQVYNDMMIARQDTYTAEMFQQLLYKALVETPNDFRYINELYKTIDLKDIEINPLLQRAYEDHYQRFDEEKARKALVVCSYAYRSKDTIILEKILEHTFPYVGKKRYANYLEYEKDRQQLSYSQLVTERMAFSFYLSLPAHVVKKRYSEVFRIELLENIVEQYVENYQLLPMDAHFDNISKHYSTRRHLEITKEHTPFKKEWTRFTSYVNEDGVLKKNSRITLADFIIDVKKRALQENPSMTFDNYTLYVYMIFKSSTMDDVTYLPMTNADVRVIGEYARIYEHFIKKPIDFQGFLQVLAFYAVLRIDARTKYMNQFLSNVSDLNDDTLDASITTRLQQHRELHDAKIEISRLKEELDNLTAQYEEKSEELTKMSNSYERVNNEYVTYRKNIAAERKKYQEQHREYNDVMRENEELRLKLSDSVDIINQTKTQLAQTEQQLQKSNEVISKYLPNNFEYQEKVKKDKEKLISILKEEPVMIIGGHIRWQNKLAQELSCVSNQLKFVDIDKRKEITLYPRHKHIFYISKYNNHGYFMQLNKELSAHQKIHYLDTTNIEQTISTMLENLTKE